MNTAKVSAAKPKVSGAVFAAPIGTALPTTASATLNQAFKELGYVTEDGLTNSNSLETEEIRAWGGDVVLTPVTGRPDEWTLSLMESLNGDVLKLVYGASNVTVDGQTGAIAVSANAGELEANSWVFDMILSDGSLKRVVLPNAKISETGDISYVDNGAITYEVTLRAMPDTNGNTHYEYIEAA